MSNLESHPAVAPCSRTLHELIISTVMILVKASKRCLACALGMCF